MEILGTIVEIIGRSMVLIETKKPLFADSVLKVFAEVTSETLEAKHGLKHLYIPKGEIRIIAKQNDNYSLGEIFRPNVVSNRIIEKPTSLLSGILGREIVEETIQGHPSALLDYSTIQLEITKKVEVGDCVGTD